MILGLMLKAPSILGIRYFILCHMTVMFFLGTFNDGQHFSDHIVMVKTILGKLITKIHKISNQI